MDTKHIINNYISEVILREYQPNCMQSNTDLNLANLLRTFR